LKAPALLKIRRSQCDVFFVVFHKKELQRTENTCSAFLCTVISDLLLFIAQGKGPDLSTRAVWHAGFIMAYLFLIEAFQRNFRFGKNEIITLILFVVIFGMVLAALAKYAVGLMFGAAIVLGL
jgi:uncharacterized membrane protein